MLEKEFDVVILGGGPAGFSAGIYTARGNVSTAILDVSMLGGQPSNYLELENYPAFMKIGGFELMEKFEEHADMFGVQKFPMQEIEFIDLVSSPKIIRTKEVEFRAKSGYISVDCADEYIERLKIVTSILSAIKDFFSSSKHYEYHNKLNK